MQYLILTIIICTIYTVYVYVKYNKDAIPSERYNFYREKLDILPAEAGYLINKNCENADLILADILTLVNEEYISMELIEDDYFFSKTEKTDFTDLKPHQMLAYNLFFQDKEKMTLKEFLKNIKHDQKQKEDAEVKYHSVKMLLDNEFENMGITDMKAKKAMIKINSFSLKLIFTIPIIFLFYFIYNVLALNNWIGSAILCIIEVFSIVLYIITNLDEDKLTIFGANLKEKALGVKHFLEENTIMEDKPFYMVDILEYNYTNAIAMGLADMANGKFSKKYIKSIKRVKRYKNEAFVKKGKLIIIILLGMLLYTMVTQEKEIIINNESTLEKNNIEIYNNEILKISIPKNYTSIDKSIIGDGIEAFFSDDGIHRIFIYWYKNVDLQKDIDNISKEELDKFVLNVSDDEKIISKTKEQIGKNQAIKIRTKNNANTYNDTYILITKKNYITLIFLGNSIEDLDNMEYQNIKKSLEIIG